MKCPRYHSALSSYFFDRSGTMWRRMKEAFEGFEDDLIVTSVSPWVMERAKRSPILAGKRHCVVLNGLDTEMVFHPADASVVAGLKNELGLKNEKIVFHASPGFNNDPNHIKGGYYVIELAKKMPEVRFVVAGPHSNDLEVPENMTLLGNLSDQKLLAQYYSMADVTLLTSRRETFSMVTAESLCCGTPVVGFKAGAPEMIALEKYSEFVEHGDLEQLEKAVTWCLNQKHISYELELIAKEKYGVLSMLKGYLSEYDKLMDKNKR